MKKLKNVGCAIISALAVITLLPSSYAISLLDEDFDGGTDGNPILAPWVTGGTGTAVYSNVTPDGGGLSANSTNTNAALSQFFFNRALSGTFDMASSDTLTMTFSVRLAQTNYQQTIRLTDNDGLNTPVAINFLDDTGIQVTNGAALSFLGIYAADVFYDVTVTLYAATDLYDVSVVNHATMASVGNLTDRNVGSTADITTFGTFAVSNNNAASTF
jgi:hypothetical protein